MNIQLFTEKNFEPLFDIDRENMKPYLDRHLKGGWGEAEGRKEFEEFIEQRNIYTITDNNILIGFLILKIVPNIELYLRSIQIKSEFQNKGFGTQAMEFVRKMAVHTNCKIIDLSVFSDNPAISLYTKLGFEKIANKRNNLILMRKQML